MNYKIVNRFYARKNNNEKVKEILISKSDKGFHYVIDNTFISRVFMSEYGAVEGFKIDFKQYRILGDRKSVV